MKTDDALYHAVHGYSGGVAELAGRMGIAAPTLYGMANPNEAGHGWTLKHVRSVLAFTGDLRPLHALCEEHGGVFVPTVREVASGEARDAMVCLAKEFGDVAVRFAKAHEDGQITRREADAFDTEIFELISQAAALALKVRESVGVKSAKVSVVK